MLKDEHALIPGDHHEGIVETLAFGGAGIVRLNRWVVFVPFTVPGDRIRFQLTEVKKSYARGKLEKLLIPSSHRILPPCPIYARCGGCQHQEIHALQALQEKSKILEGLLKHGLHLQEVPMEPPLASPLPFLYRNKMQLAVGKGIDEKLTLGLYQPQSHIVTDMPSCLIQEEANHVLIEPLRLEFQRLQWPPYDEKTKTGLLRHLLVRTNRKKETYVVLVATSLHLPGWEKLLTALRNISPALAGFAVNLNHRRTNAVLGEKTMVLWGKNYLEETIESYTYRYSPTAFFQVNSLILSATIQVVLEWGNLSFADGVLDLYCGVGTFSIPFAKKAGLVAGIEENPEAVFWAKENAKINGVPQAKFIAGSVEKELEKLMPNRYTIVFLDPPRRGIDSKGVQKLVSLKPRKILYLSCNPPTLVRDLGFFLKHGYALTRIRCLDFFPQTAQIEALALLER